MKYDFDFINSSFRAKDWLEENYGCEFSRSSSGYLNCSCPFEDHNDSSPSFGISEDKYIYNCFGCGRSGDFVALVANLLNTTFSQAIHIICVYEGIDSAGVDNIETSSDKFYKSIAEHDMALAKKQRCIMKATNKIRRVLKKDFEKGEELYKKLDEYISKSNEDAIQEIASGKIT